jgi:hypothetical protein
LCERTQTVERVLEGHLLAGGLGPIGPGLYGAPVIYRALPRPDALNPIQPPYNLDGGAGVRTCPALDIRFPLVGLGRVLFLNYRRKDLYVVLKVVLFLAG